MTERTFSELLGIPLAKRSDQALFQLLVLCILMSKRISYKLALRAAAALFNDGFVAPIKVLEADRKDIVRVLNNNGYARYDEMTASYLKHNAQYLMANYGGMTKLIAAAQRRPDKLEGLLREFKGIGPVGASIFASEAQVAYPWLFPSISPKALALMERSNSVIDDIDRVKPIALARFLSSLVMSGAKK